MSRLLILWWNCSMIFSDILVTRWLLLPSDFTKIQFRPGLCPGPHWGSLQHSPRPPSWWGGGRGLAARSPRTLPPPRPSASFFGPSALRLWPFGPCTVTFFCEHEVATLILIIVYRLFMSSYVICILCFLMIAGGLWWYCIVFLWCVWWQLHWRCMEAVSCGNW